MKKSGNVITYYWKENMAPDRLIDKLSYYLGKRKIISFHDRWTIEQNMRDGSNRACGAFYTITGSKWLVDFLSWATNVHLGKTNKVKLETENDGTITNCEDYKP